MNLIPIDELIETWREKMTLDNDLEWWREACHYLHPDAPPLDDDNEIINE